MSKSCVRSKQGLSSRSMRMAAVSSVAAVTIWLATLVRAQDGTRTIHDDPLPPATRAGKLDWPLHNFDLRNSRYSSLDEINVSNVKDLTVKWSVQSDEPLGEVTPLVINGVMYYHTSSRLSAVNAASGEAIWTLEMEPGSFGTWKTRGPAYGDGKIYAFGPSVLYAVDAKTGKLVKSFGDTGVLRVVNAALERKYPGKYPAALDPRNLGYSMTAPPAYFGGTVYVGLPFSEGHIPGGLVIAVDGTTGTIKWVFNTVPQGPADDGWEIAKDTWGTGARAGGGIWTQPAIDSELGMIYFNATNPSPDYDGSARRGINLFTNSTIALNLATGKLIWYYQTIHHDIWDWDVANGPLLFDLAAGGRTIKGIAAAGKPCFVYFWHRETGQPINPIVETAVPTKSDVPGEEAWPTQPIPYTSKGVPMQPFCATYPIIADPELARRARPQFTPYSASEFMINAAGGALYGGSSFSPRTGLFYVSGRNGATSIMVKPVGDTITPGRRNLGHFGNVAAMGENGVSRSHAVTAYEPATGRQVWQAQIPGTTNSGNFTTGGDLVFQGVGTGVFYAFDARSGDQLFAYTAPAGIISSPLTYQVDGKQYVTVLSGSTILTFGLPYERETVGERKSAAAVKEG